MEPFGCFPFGRPNTLRPAREPTRGPAAAAVVGVYPSAWHVAWTAPAYLRSPSRRGTVAALAVDVEPTVFWEGDSEGFLERLAVWKAEVGFTDGDDPGAHGRIGNKSPAANGSSGAKLEARYLTPLGIAAASTAFTDVYPVFMIKSSGRGNSVRREQGDAITSEYDVIARKLGFQPSSLPQRSVPKNLVTEASSRFKVAVQVPDGQAAAGGARVVGIQGPSPLNRGRRASSLVMPQCVAVVR